jgi:ketosteroid isomerase-like protein
MVFEFRAEKIARARDFLDRSEALRAARLAEWAMSANLDLVRSLFTDWKRGDYSSTDWADPEIEFVIADGPSPGAWTGVAGMIEAYREVMNAWQHYGGEAEEYRVLDEQRVLVLIHLSGRGKVSGLELEQMQPKAAGILQVRDGKVVKVVLYYDRKRALADLGLAD